MDQYCMSYRSGRARPGYRGAALLTLALMVTGCGARYQAEAPVAPAPYRVVFSGVTDNRPQDARERDAGSLSPLSRHNLLEELNRAVPQSVMVPEVLVTHVVLLDYTVTGYQDGRTMSMAVQFEPSRPANTRPQDQPLMPVMARCAVNLDGRDSGWAQRSDHAKDAWQHGDVLRMNAAGRATRLWDTMFQQCATRLTHEYGQALNGTPLTTRK